MSVTRIQLRRDAAASWTELNPILLEGELGLETDTTKLKLGDGVTPWTELPYYTAGPDSIAELLDVDTQDRVDGSVLIYDEVRAMFTATPLNTKLTLADGGNF